MNLCSFIPRREDSAVGKCRIGKGMYDLLRQSVGCSKNFGIFTASYTLTSVIG